MSYYLLVLISIFHTVLSIDFDYYVFSRSWAPTFCAVNQQSICHKNSSLTEEFTVHGLWPTWRNGSWPQYCTDESFDPGQVVDINIDLSSHWSDNGQSDIRWWSHEWSKHGTCAIGHSGIASQRDYFATCLCLDIKSGANSKNLVPSITQSYQKTNLSHILGASLHCEKIPKYGNKSLLSELRVAVSIDLQNIEPLPDDESCQEEVYLLPYN